MKKIFWIILATLLLIEEWLWDGLNHTGHSLVRLFNWQRYEQWLTQCTAPQALLCFFIPTIVITPLNLLALKMLATGLVIQGITLEIAIKLFATLFISRIFSLTKPQLFHYRLIKRLYDSISDALHWARCKVENLTFYQKTRQLKAELIIKAQHWSVFSRQRK